MRAAGDHLDGLRLRGSGVSYEGSTFWLRWKKLPGS